MKNNIIMILVGIILLLGAGNYIQYRSAVNQESYRKDENERFQVESERKLGEIRARDGQIQALLNERTKDSTKHASDQRGFKTRLNALRAKVSGPAMVQDTIIVIQDSLIADMSAQIDTLYLTDNQALDSLQASVTQLKVMYQEQYHRASKFELQYDREKRKRWSLGPHAGYGFKGADFGVSIQYSIWRF